ncbi:phosphate transport system protein [Streptococcus rupicaprae]|uniref:Phosphate-specific transport system accessory protein PhoU n=1 Tax=Streptococcus rupicaprae TaxID=759619 RepID=A0ABV2FGD6_9STRE
MLRQAFEQSLVELHHDLYDMGQAVLSQLERTAVAFQEENSELAAEIMVFDEDINFRELALETKSVELMALQHPVGGDLRRIITVLKASSDIERMGDHLRSIAQSIIQLSNSGSLSEMTEPINAIFEALTLLLEETFETYRAQDPDKAILIATWDETINRIYKETQDRLTDYIKNYPERIENGREYYQILLHLERLGDYAKDVCAWIVYLGIGKIVNL